MYPPAGWERRVARVFLPLPDDLLHLFMPGI
jgi:hypothetical protein